ncbi:MAG: hypothetical protein ACFB0C_04280 [Leptolyngbyaceae cyanobacterium]
MKRFWGKSRTMSSSLEMIQAQRVEYFLQVLSWVSDRFGLNQPPIVNLDDLRSLAPDSLGYAWAEHLDANGLQPFDQGMRRQQLHDGLHVLTGYGIDPIGEAEVQAFLLGAKFRLVHILLLGGTVMGINRRHRHQLIVLSPGELRARLRAAYDRGRNSLLDPDTWRPEILWEQSLADVQGAFGL